MTPEPHATPQGPWVFVVHNPHALTVLGPFATEEEAHHAWAHVSSAQRVRKGRPHYRFTFRRLKPFRPQDWPL